VFGWQAVMLAYWRFALALHPAGDAVPEAAAPNPPSRRHGMRRRRDAGPRVAGMHPNVAQALICVAGFCCCIPMSVPAGAHRRLLRRHRHQADALARDAVG
jgi:hypothetical protein